MKIVLTGATGTARRDPGLQHPKLKFIPHSDFTDYAGVLPALRDHDACLWCLGVSQNAVTEAEYRRITYDYALAGARAMAGLKPDFRFCFLSGQGADSKEKSRFLFGRVKGQTENALSALGRPRAFHFRPGYIHPTREGTRKWMDKWIGHALAPLMRVLAPGAIVETPELARAMIRVAREGSARTILENNDIRALAA